MTTNALDRVSDSVDAIKGDFAQFDTRFRAGDLVGSELALRAARDRLTRSITTLRRRGR